MTYNEFQKLARPGRIIPVYRRLNADFLTPIMAYIKLRSTEHYSFLLESVIKGQHLGRYSFIGNTPLDVNQFYLSATDHSNNGDFFRQLQDQLHQYQSVTIADLPRFTGGAVGFIGYDMIRQIEEIPYPEADHIRIPDAVMAFYHELIAFDHLKNQVILIANTIVEEESNPGI